MTKLQNYWKALAPTVALVTAAANAAGPDNKVAYVVIALLGLLGTILAPKNVPAA